MNIITLHVRRSGVGVAHLHHRSIYDPWSNCLCTHRPTPIRRTLLENSNDDIVAPTRSKITHETISCNFATGQRKFPDIGQENDLNVPEVVVFSFQKLDLDHYSTASEAHSHVASFF
jgi:hypothetical protein